MIVPESSATLEYPGEVRVGLNGDHLNIAKYSSNRDPNFVKLATTLRKIVADVQVNDANVPHTTTSDNS